MRLNSYFLSAPQGVGRIEEITSCFTLADITESHAGPDSVVYIRENVRTVCVRF